jgi:hypothetical protein
MKKLLTLLAIGLAVLLLLSFIPSNSIESEISNNSEDGYLTLVPVKPPQNKPPTK